MEEYIRQSIITKNLEDVLHESMLPYAEYVILERALPRIEDGLKPVQRRILYSMYEQGMTPDKGYKKSARVVGDCLAKYHPHGDSSVYDAMVRMAQPYNMGMTLVDGQGNFGSIDGDSAAAMRYTEVKLQPLALELLKDIDKNTVRWKPNFDDSQNEPDILPGRFPNLLVNGATGIAVGLATNIPTHNLCEVIDGAIAYLKNPKITIDEIMQIVKGPDFPTGGYVICGKELKTAYETGKGKIRMRAKMHIETEGDKSVIVITEIPYQINKADLLKKIDDLSESKKELFGDIVSVNDESDRKGMRAVIKLKKDADVNKILAGLYKYSNIESSFSINMVAIADGKPRQLGLLDYYGYYTDYQKSVVLKRTKYDLDKAKERAHILEGLIVAVTNIDEVIRIIKTSPDTPTARQNLRSAFNLTERQANAILDLRLARITKLEVDNLKEELRQLELLIKEYTSIIESKAKLIKVVESELLQIKKKFGEERRSVIVNSEEEISVKQLTEQKASEVFMLGLNVLGKIRKTKIANYKKLVKEAEPQLRDVYFNKITVRNDQTVLMITNRGNLYKVDAEVIEEARGLNIEGYDFNSLVKDSQSGEKLVAMLATSSDEMQLGQLLFATKNGLVKISEFAEYNLLKSPYLAMKIDDNDELISVQSYDKDKNIFFVTKKGMCVNCNTEFPVYKRVSGGVKGIDLYEDDSLIGVELVTQEDYITVGATNGCFKNVAVSEIGELPKARKGVKIFELGDAKYNESLVFATSFNNGENKKLVIVDRLSQVYYTETDAITYESRVTKGKIVSSVGKIMPETVAVYDYEGEDKPSNPKKNKSESKDKEPVKKTALTENTTEKIDKKAERKAVSETTKKVEKPLNESIKGKKSSKNEGQISFFEEKEVNYDKAQADVDSALKKSKEILDEVAKNKGLIAVEEKQALKGINEYIQAIIITKELYDSNDVNQKNLELAVNSSQYGNLFAEAKNLEALKSFAKNRLLTVPQVFMVSAVYDIKNVSKLSKSLYDRIKAVYVDLYEDDGGFEILTKQLIAFLKEKTITI